MILCSAQASVLEKYTFFYASCRKMQLLEAMAMEGCEQPGEETQELAGSQFAFLNYSS